MKMLQYTNKIPMGEDTLYLDLDNDLEWVQLKTGVVYKSENAGEVYTECLGSYVWFEEMVGE